MKLNYSIPIVLTLFFLTNTFFADNISENTKKVKIYTFDIKEEIAPPILRKVIKAFEEAEREKADIIIITMNTYGGMVDAADSIRTRILRSRIPVYVLIENNAASAGALISLACDSIYMKPGATIGAATVVDQSGQAVPDKYQSYMRKKMRATAEETGRNPDMAEAMVDPDKVVPGISDSGKVLTLTVKEALQYGFCEAELNSTQEIFERTGVKEYEILEQKLTFIDNIIGFLILPAISSILIMIVIGGIYFELQTPGVGFPIIASILAAVLYFAPLYLEGLAANWEILLFVVGLILIALELFAIPGFGVAGISGIICVVAGLTLSMVGNVGFDFSFIDSNAIIQSLFIVIVSSVLSLSASLYLGGKLLKSSAFKHLVLQTTQQSKEGYISTDITEFNLIGKKGTAFTILRPAGKVDIEGEIYDATAEIGYIEKGELIEVIKYETAQLFVRKI